MHGAQLGRLDFQKRRREKKEGKQINFSCNQEIHVNSKLGKGAFV
jgi:hypothetical protein